MTEGEVYIHKLRGGKNWVFKSHNFVSKIALFEQSEFAILEIQDLENTNFFSI